jgi:hypothetical protein
VRKCCKGKQELLFCCARLLIVSKQASLNLIILPLFVNASGLPPVAAYELFLIFLECHTCIKKLARMIPTPRPLIKSATKLEIVMNELVKTGTAINKAPVSISQEYRLFISVFYWQYNPAFENPPQLLSKKAFCIF